ncbi:MerR family transcriptional regulator [Bacillus sp. FJAT-42376]|uniref:MerR family transcriptional regulator n=1 Tax=Bacillus sp. FJAT-42376 TaxID=2014076 RepID=UPI0013DE2ED8|nr:MerR family transcriptional regulator [Bacillus sp. FJAT-42376]
MYFSTGEVSKKLNVTLRTLRYYDQIGLVKPAKTDEYGKRFYSEENMLLLEKICLLKSASMPLKDTLNIINQVTSEEILLLHKEQLEIQIKHLQEGLGHTTALLHTWRLEGEINWEQLLPLVNLQKQFDLEHSQFSEEERSALVSRLPKLEDEKTGIWIHLIKRIKRCIEEGTSYDSQEGQLIAGEIIRLSEHLFQNDRELENKFWESRKQERVSADLNLFPVKQEVLKFIEEAVIYCEETSRNKKEML